MKLNKITSSAIAISFILMAARANASSGSSARRMEYLTRGTVAVSVSGGIYISWRLLGTESVQDQTFDIYRNDILIHTTDVSSPTCYMDETGTSADRYKVVR